MVDYDKLPIRCRECISWKHKASDYKDAMKRPQIMREKGRPMHAYNNQQSQKGKNQEVNADGFQQVKKNT